MRPAYFKVLRLSSKCWPHGEILAIIRVWQLPPRESLSSLVSLESRKGIWFEMPLVLLRWSILIQLPKANNDLLILAPSFILSPVFPDCEALSDPAKSTRENLPIFTYFLNSCSAIVCSHVIWKIAWDLDEVSLDSVASWTRLRFPSTSNLRMSFADLTMISDTPAI